MNEKKGIRLILERNIFYSDQYKKSYLILLALLLINVLLIIGIVYKVMNPIQPTYFASTGTGRIIPDIPLDQPVWDDDYILQWTSDHVVAAFNIDYIHWRSQLASASSAFTQAGWINFNKALKESNTLSLVTDGMRIAYAEVTGAAKVVRKMAVGGQYAWSIQLPLLVRYIKPGESDVRVSYNATIVVLRQDVKNYPDRIAINNILPNLQG